MRIGCYLSPAGFDALVSQAREAMGRRTKWILDAPAGLSMALR